jgi:exopolyphosphatase / guanosine-5'-triphosphate,3'-diphosphate pyrophosphatase
MSADLRLLHHGGVRVGVIDVGSNTVRLLVANGGGTVEQRRAIVGLGRAIEETGSIPEEKLAETADRVAEWVAVARRRRVERLDVLVTSPGRQAANGDELLERLAASARVPVRLLSSAEEGRLAFLGALARTRGSSDGVIAVCDVGGGSAQVVVGATATGPAWVRSVDLGSLRLTTRLLSDDPPSDRAVAEARAAAADAFAAVIPPVAQLGLAAGGTARALRRVAEGLDGDGLEEAIGVLAGTKRSKISKRWDIPPARAATLLSGTILFAEAQRRLGIPLELAAGGVREGSVLALFRESAAAYA